MVIHQSALYIIRTLQERGFIALLAGGCVRDQLLNITPHDWDIATSALPDEIEKIFPRTIAVGKSFGVIVVLIDEDDFAVATFRTDGDYVDGRRPQQVNFSSPAIDAQRRDFTINAMFYDPIKNELIDYTHGQDDLKNKIIRTVGDPALRFREDHLRLLRAVRFAARFNFTLEAKTADAIREMATLSNRVSGERLGEELTKILTNVGAENGLRLLAELNLLPVILPEVAQMQGVQQPPEFHPEGDVWQHTLLMFHHYEKKLPEDIFSRTVLSWAILLHDVAKPVTKTFTDRWRFNEHDLIGAQMAQTILQRLKQPNQIIAAVYSLIIRHMHFMWLNKMRVAKRRRFLQDPLFPLHLQLHYFDCVASHKVLDNYEHAKKAWQEELALPPPIPRLLSGDDLIALGFEPSAQFREILTALDDEILEGTITNRDDALKWVGEKFTAFEY